MDIVKLNFELVKHDCPGECSPEKDCQFVVPVTDVSTA